MHLNAFGMQSYVRSRSLSKTLIHWLIANKVKYFQSKSFMYNDFDLRQIYKFIHVMLYNYNTLPQRSVQQIDRLIFCTISYKYCLTWIDSNINDRNNVFPQVMRDASLPTLFYFVLNKFESQRSKTHEKSNIAFNIARIQ